ncbi:MAG: arginine deiminase family protein, partial [Candidatus Hodarchaeales archaeon]
MKYGATCEYHPLKTVLVFRPGDEVKQITSDTYRELSFRDVVYWRRFQQEHDLFIELLREEKIDIILLNDLLQDEDQSVLDPNLVFTRDAGAV